MLKQASVTDLTMGRISKDEGHIVITMRRYPRFVNKKLRDEYLTCMSPEKKLFEDWLEAKRKYQDHDGAFFKSHFEERFEINEEGIEHLARLSALAHEKDVYLICQCKTGERCHREFLLIMAKWLFNAETASPANKYPIFEKRVTEWKRVLKRQSKRKVQGIDASA